MEVLLSICIPTYNRCEYLKKTIESIIVQDEFKSGQVEIVISDNASTDNTNVMIEQYTSVYDNIKYYRNKENIRDKNYPLVLSYGCGLLRKLNNDTFMLKPNSLAEICKTILLYRGERPNIFFSNEKYGNSRHNKIKTINQLLLDRTYWITSIQTFSIWADQCDNLINNAECCDLLLWQVNKLLSLGKNNNFLIFRNSIGTVQNVSNKDISYGLFEVFYVNFFKIIDRYVVDGVVDINIRKYIEKRLLFEFFSFWILTSDYNAKHYSFSNVEDLKCAVRDAYKKKPYWLWYSVFYFFKKIVFKAKKQ